jgi:hypothetical protein
MGLNLVLYANLLSGSGWKNFLLKLPVASEGKSAGKKFWLSRVVGGGCGGTERDVYPKQVEFLFAEMRREAHFPEPILRKRVQVRILSGRLLKL